MSETFQAPYAQSVFTLSGASGSNSGPANPRNINDPISFPSFTVAYDAATNSFLLTAPDLTQTLQLGQVSTTPGGGSALLNFYQGAGATAFVRMAEWLNATPGLGQTDYRLGYFAFGMDTPQSGLVRTGQAGYQVAVRGGAGDADFPNIMTFNGNGSIFVDFASSRLRASIPLSFTEDFSGSRTPFTETGSLLLDGVLQSTTPSFTGNVRVTGGIGEYSGTLEGKFFGPSGNEIGGAVDAYGPAGARAVSTLSAAFAGSLQGTATDPEPAIKRLDQTFGAPILGVEQGYNWPFAAPALSRVVYDHSTDTYTVTFPESRVFIGSAGDRVSPAGTAAFSAATQDGAQPLSGFDAHTAQLDPSTSVKAFLLRQDNPTVQLSYVTLGGFAVETSYTNVPNAPGPALWYRQYAAFGNRSISVPVSGTAAYNGVVLGWATVMRQENSINYFDRYDVTGHSRLSVDFGAGTFAITMDQLAGVRPFVESSAYPGGGTFAFGAINHSGLISRGGLTGADAATTLTGGFYGPNAAEFGAVFRSLHGVAGSGALSWELMGATAGKKE